MCLVVFFSPGGGETRAVWLSKHVMAGDFQGAEDGGGWMMPSRAARHGVDNFTTTPLLLPLLLSFIFFGSG